jgi:hypothetical protein
MTEMIPLGPTELAHLPDEPVYLLTSFTTNSVGRYLRAGTHVKFSGIPGPHMQPLARRDARRRRYRT